MSGSQLASIFVFASLPAFAAMPVRSSAVPCAGCHQTETRDLLRSAMAHALQPIAECDILKTHRNLTFQQDRYRYRVSFTGDSATYEVTNGTQTLRVPLEWAFGLGDAGQTYVFRRNGNFYESHVSFYRSIHGAGRHHGRRIDLPVKH